MAKQKYRLRPVLSVRERAKQDAAKLLAARREQLVDAETELLRRQTALAACRDRQAKAQERMIAETKGGSPAHDLVIHRTHLTDLRRVEEELRAEVEAQRRTVAAAEIEVEQAVTGLIEASKEVQIIAKHHESWQLNARRQEERREQKLGDEIGVNSHHRGRVR